MGTKFILTNSRGITFDLVNGDIQMNTDITQFESERQYTPSITNAYINLQEVPKLEERELTFEATVRREKNIRDFKSFLLESEMQFLLRIENDAPLNDYFCYCKLGTHNSKHHGASNLYTITFSLKLQSRFLLIKKYMMTLNSQSAADNPYPITYPAMYPMAENTFANSQIKFTVGGNYPASFRLEILGVTSSPKAALNDSYENTHLAFGSDIIGGPNDIVECSSSQFDQHITKNGQSIEQTRDVSKFNFFDIPIGENIFYLNNITSANLYIYEEHDDYTI